MLDDCIARVKELISRREEIDAELSALLNIEPHQSDGKPLRRCSKCGEAGHRATTCPQGKVPLLLASTPVV